MEGKMGIGGGRRFGTRQFKERGGAHCGNRRDSTTIHCTKVSEKRNEIGFKFINLTYSFHFRRSRTNEDDGAPSSSQSQQHYYPAWVPPVPPEPCRALVPYVPPQTALVPQSESGNETVITPSEGGIADEISVTSDTFNPVLEDDAVSTGSGFIYDETRIQELNGDRYGQKRLEVEREKEELIGTSIVVSGQSWKVIGDVESDDISFEDFLEQGVRSDTLDFESLPKRFRRNIEILRQHGRSPRRSPRLNVGERDETKAIHHLFLTLYPVDWKKSLQRLNKAIKIENPNTRTKIKSVSENEYWKFIGLLLLCAVQKIGVEPLFKGKETQGIVEHFNGSKFMTHTRFKFIKRFWMRQFELDVDNEYKERNKWWKVGHLVQGFNNNRAKTVAASRVKTFDESMSPYKPQSSKTGNLPNISFILRKPEPLGTELKTVASTGSNGPMLYAEIQEGKEGMKTKPFFRPHGATCACVLRLGKATKNHGQNPDPLIRNLFYGDSWFASLKTAVQVTEELDAEFVGPVKTSHKQFPKTYLENTMKTWPPGSHLVMQTELKGKSYYAIGYKYNMKKVLSFIATEGAGHTKPGEPYEAKWLDDNGRACSRKVPRPHILSEYFSHSNQIDKHNHARQSQLGIEKYVVVECGYFRLFCTYLGITVTDAWKLYRAGLGEDCANKDISILSFANILCKTHLLNDYNKTKYESTPTPTLRSLDSSSRKELPFPNQITTNTNANASVLSSLGSGSNMGLVEIGPGKYIPVGFTPFHEECQLQKETSYEHAVGSYAEYRRSRGRCKVCGKKTALRCTVCGFRICDITLRKCFYIHKKEQVQAEREQHWEDLQCK